MKKTSLVICALIAIVTVLFSFTKPKGLYENLKVLPKNTTKEQMDSIMKHFTGSLGVKCNFCHVRLDNEKKDWDFANDEKKHKLIARDMLRMTQTINKKFFKDEARGDGKMQMANQVTCYTCHNGKEEPGRLPPLQQGPGGARPAGQQQGEQPRNNQPRPELPKP